MCTSLTLRQINDWRQRGHRRMANQKLLETAPADNQVNSAPAGSNTCELVFVVVIYILVARILPFTQVTTIILTTEMTLTSANISLTFQNPSCLGYRGWCGYHVPRISATGDATVSAIYSMFRLVSRGDYR